MENQEKHPNDEIRQLTETLNKGISSLRKSVEWQKYLKVMSMFPKYSYRNSLLIMQQTNGTATHVMSYNSWPKINRHVKRGAKAIKIISPCPIKQEVEKAVTDEKGYAKLTTTGQVITETAIETVMSFKPTPVFDIKDTDGEPLPTCMVDELKGHVNRFDTIKKAIIDSSPVPVVYGSISNGAKGFYSPNDKKIVIREDLSNMHQIHTLLHESAHAMLDISGADKDKTRSVKELEAESIAFVAMCHILGDDITPEDVGQYSFGYLSVWSGEDDDLNEMKSCLGTIQKTSSELIKTLDAKIEEYLLSEKDEIVYKLSDGYISLKRSDDGFDYALYNSAYQIISADRIKNISPRLDKAAKTILELSDIPTMNMTYYDTCKFREEINKSGNQRHILATEICISCYGEDPLSETYVGPSEQEIYTMLSNGIAGEFYHDLRIRSLRSDAGGKYAADLLSRIDKIAPMRTLDTKLSAAKSICI